MQARIEFSFKNNTSLRASILFALCAILSAGGSARAQQGSWVRLAPVGEARQEVAVAELDGKIYLVGGLRSDTVSTTVEVYDPKTDRWSFIAPLPEPLHHTSAVSLNGKIYVIGGYNTLTFNPVDSAFRYDPTENRWAAIASLPTRRGALASVVIGNKIYTVGGARGVATGELTVYDPATDLWTELVSMPTAREHIAAGAIKGKLYVAGGRRPGNFTLNTLEEYDPAGNTWQEREPMPTGRSGIAGAVVGDRFYVFGGEGNANSPTGTFPQNESYDPATDTWRAEVPMPTPRHGIGAAAINERIYIPAGSPVQGFGITDINEAFVVTLPQPDQPPKIEPIPAQTVRGGEQLCLDLVVSDPEGEPVTITCAAENPAFVKCTQGRTVCLAPGPTDEGNFTACVIARDSAGNETKSCFAITVIINHRPRLDKPADLTLFEGDMVEVKVKATDEDTGRDPAVDGRLTLALLEGPSFARFSDGGSGLGTLLLTPGAGSGGSSEQVYTITIEARDNGNPPLKTSVSFLVTVKAASQPSMPIITSAEFKAKKLTIAGLRLAPSPQVEINGRLTDPTRISLQSETQIVLTGAKKRLNLKSGENILVVIVGGVRSAPFSLMIGK